MTLSPPDLALYAGALFVLFITPGPVWLAVLARTLSGGARATLPLALGVMTGDMLWSLLAVLGVSWVVSVLGGAMVALRWVAAALFVGMGALLIRHADHAIAADRRLTRPGAWAGYVAGLAAILGNPKAILFYMGVLPGFFDLTRATLPDIASVVALSALVPLVGNLALALTVSRLRRRVATPAALRRLNLTAGWLLIAVAAAIVAL